jgi:methyl-accepting chemotaxis protein
MSGEYEDLEQPEAIGMVLTMIDALKEIRETSVLWLGEDAKEIQRKLAKIHQISKQTLVRVQEAA